MLCYIHTQQRQASISSLGVHMASRDHEEEDSMEEEEYDDYDDDEIYEDDEDQEPAPSAGTQQAASAAAAPAGGLTGLPARPGGLPGLPPPKGLAGSLPARGSQEAKQAAPGAGAGAGAGSSGSTGAPSAPATTAAASTSPAAMPKLPPKGGLPGLPARPGLGGAAGAGAGSGASAGSSGSSSTGAPSLPQRPAGLGPSATGAASSSATAPSLPARPAGLGGVGGLAPRPGGGAPAPPAATATAAPTAAPASSSPAAGAGGAGAPRPQPPQPASAIAAQLRQAVAAPPQPPADEAVDPSEDKKGRSLQAKVQSARVRLIRAAGRLGLRYDSSIVSQFLGVINRVEEAQGSLVYKKSKGRVPEMLSRAAERGARESEAAEAADSKLDVRIKVLVLGMSGTGKSELINSILGRPAARTSAFRDSTKSVKVVRGSVHGIQLEFIDTPGLHASSSSSAANRSILKAVRAAYRWHKPHYVFWVDRLDTGRAALAELGVLGLVNEVLGSKVWRETMVVLTHAHAAREALGPAQYDQYSRQRRNIVAQALRQAVGDMQMRNPIFVADCHPSCPTNNFGQPIIYEGAQAVPWKQGLLIQLVGYRLYEEVQALFKAALKKKSGPTAQAAAKQQDLFKQLMRPRLPPASYYVEMLCEGILAPESWGAHDDPLDQASEDLEAEEFEHAYYRIMYDLACNGNPWAQKEYAAMLDKQARVRRTYAEAFEEEDINQMAASGYEGYVADGLDLGPTFDPVDNTNHRYVYPIGEADWQLMPTLDYYGFEHEDAINGIVAEYDGQPFARHGWGGIPLNLHVALEKDKTSFCVQGEAHLSLVHSVPPFGSRHITQVNAAAELLRPNVKDVLYQLDINTFKDGLLSAKDHAGVGVLVTRLGEGGKLNKGPSGMGLRVQDTMRVGPLKIEACAAKMTAASAQGGQDVAWGARTFVRYDHLPGVGMIFDFYQQRNKETDPNAIGGWAGSFSYDFALAGAACGVEVDYVPGQQSLHVDMNVYCGNSYNAAWLLVVPAWNLLKGWFQQARDAIRGGGDMGEMEMEEGEEGEEGDDMLGGEPQQKMDMQQLLQLMGARMQG